MADAQASGACGSNIVWVQVPSPAFNTGRLILSSCFLFVYIVLHKFSYNKFPPPNTGGGTHTASLCKYFTLQILTFKLFLRHRFSKIISLNQLYFHTLYDLILSVMFYTLYAYSNPDCLSQLCNKLNKSI